MAIPSIVFTIIAGFLGGVVRATVGLLKWQVRAPTQKRLMNFSMHYLVASLMLAGILGTVAGMFIMDDIRFSFLAGYAGTDFVEGLYKAKFKGKKKSLTTS